MQYRNFGKLDWKPSALGFGAMRLPTLGEDQSNVDEEQTIKMIRYAADNGVNYIDSAYMYHMGKSEIVVGKALKDGYRQKFRVATKLPVNMMQKGDDCDRILDEQIKKLDVGKIDFYLFHGLSKMGWEKVKEWKLLDWAEKRMAKGDFSYLCFSFHDEFPVFKEIIDGYDNWTMAQIQYNYMDENSQAGRRGVEYAASKGLAIVVMEPLRGGKLSKEPTPKPVAEVIAKAGRNMKAVEWALQWVWNQPEISLALSGMSTMEQVKENVAIAKRSKAGIFSKDDLKVIEDMVAAYKSLSPIPAPMPLRQPAPIMSKYQNLLAS